MTTELIEKSSEELTAPEPTGTSLSKDMTPAEVKHALARLHGAECTQRTVLLEMYDGNAHKAAGYSSWDQFLKAEIPNPISYRRFNELLEAERTSRAIILQLSSDDPESENTPKAIAAITSAMSTDSLQEFKRLRDPDKLAEVFTEVVEATPKVKKGGVGRIAASIVRNAVNRALGITEPTVDPEPDAPVRGRGRPAGSTTTAKNGADAAPASTEVQTQAETPSAPQITSTGAESVSTEPMPDVVQTATLVSVVLLPKVGKHNRLGVTVQTTCGQWQVVVPAIKVLSLLEAANKPAETPAAE